MVNWRLHLGALGFYLALTLWLTWPLTAGFTTHYYTGGNYIFYYPTSPDAPQNIWNFWMSERALQAGQSPLRTELLYYPEGVQMILQTLNVVAVLMAAPLTASFGPIAAYNFTAIFAVMLTGYAGFLLTRAFVPNLVGPPLLAGALLTASPFHIAKLDAGQLNFVTMQWLVFFILAFIVLQRGQLRRAGGGLAALAFALVLYTDWYWTLVAVLFGMMWAALSLLGAQRPLALVGRYVGFGGLAILVSLPLLLALRAAPSSPLENSPNPIWAIYTQAYSADALGFFFPAARHPLWGVPVEHFLVAMAPYSVTEGSYTAAGWTLAALALLGTFWFWREHWRLVVIGGVAWIFALGPSLYVLGYATGITMPYRLLQLLPFLETARRPNLFGVLTIIIAAIFAALALAELRRRLTPSNYKLAMGVLVIVALIELWPAPRVANTLERAPVYAQIANDPGVVVDLPLEMGTDSRTLINQMVHGQPILQGYVARAPFYATILYSPLPRQLALMQRWPEEDIVALDAASLKTMQCYYQLRYVVLDRPLLQPEQQQVALALIDTLGGNAAQPWYADEQRWAYELPLHQDRCAPFLFLGAGWHDREVDETHVWRWTMGHSEIYIINPDSEPQLVSLEFMAMATVDGQQLELWNNGVLLNEFTIIQARRRYKLPLWLPPGQHRFVLHTPTTSEGVGKRELGMTVLWLRVY
ncbi:hypothetical protein [Candidatus Viridilinea mediisalina]|uniref:Glycosyltransferase RgtA/B/C/D-like domain-containing protein n=1 Tax=Candidatus Viridilinea mediisalina TaxID=2024553 RepID=A0A2A6RN08_9CHLR|nr:hypothetical protein [Candidatus Viridilinea mediisalina]PDW04442.1 hypothetical protein CJ255_03410 [Candidatus Viridilinea mediisalina]